MTLTSTEPAQNQQRRPDTTSIPTSSSKAVSSRPSVFSLQTAGASTGGWQFGGWGVCYEAIKEIFHLWKISKLKKKNIKAAAASVALIAQVM